MSVNGNINLNGRDPSTDDRKRGTILFYPYPNPYARTSKTNSRKKTQSDEGTSSSMGFAYKSIRSRLKNRTCNSRTTTNYTHNNNLPQQFNGIGM